MLVKKIIIKKKTIFSIGLISDIILGIHIMYI